MSTDTFSQIIASFPGVAPEDSIAFTSLRTAYELATKGDTATARQVLQYVAVPEPLKSAILTQSNIPLPTASSQTTIESSTPISLSAVSEGVPWAPSVTVANHESGEGTAIPTARLSNESIVAPEQLVAPSALAKESKAISAIASLPPEAVADYYASTIVAETKASDNANPSSLESLFDKVTKPDVATISGPISTSSSDLNVPVIPAGKRTEVFSQLFSNAQHSKATASSGVIAPDAQIPVIKTYAVPEPGKESSLRSKTAIVTLKKQFILAEQYLRKAISAKNDSVIASAVRQIQNLVAKYPDYLVAEPAHIQILNDLITGANSDTGIIGESTPSSQGSGIPQREELETFTGTIKEETSKVDTASDDSKEVPIDTTAPVTPTLVAASVGVTPPIPSPISTQSTSISTGAPHQTLPSHTLREIKLGKTLVKVGMTMTEKRTYTVTDIIRSGILVTIVFTDSTGARYSVPGGDLARALSDKKVTPDLFFTHYTS